jgi:UDP-N-acetylmuramoylalanine--D-glutamate ligase
MKYINEKLIEFNSEIKDKKIAIIGLGISNQPLVDYFLKNDAIPICFDTGNPEKIDKKFISKLDKLGVEYHIGPDSLKELKDVSYIFRTPGIRPDVPEITKAIKKGAILTSEIEKVLELTPSKVIGVTGSDGKSTTTTIIYNILKDAGYNCFLGGNIGFPLFTRIAEMTPDDYVVLELSSFQLLTCKISPEIAIVTNISPNHLNVHKDYQEYIDAKKNIFTHQDKNGLLIINRDNDITKSFKKEAKGNVLYFSHKISLKDGAFFDMKDRTIKLAENGVVKNVCKQSDMKLIGVHNCENACAAIAATKHLVKIQDLKKTIENFPGVEHRLEFIRKINDIPWYNDSIGSSPSRTIAGLNSFDKKIVLIAGGADKNIDYAPIALPILEHCTKLILIGQTADKIETAVENELEKSNGKYHLDIYRCTTYKEVVAKAKEVSVEGELVLFSPASTSFDMFKNFEERGNKFKDLVNNL